MTVNPHAVPGGHPSGEVPLSIREVPASGAGWSTVSQATATTARAMIARRAAQRIRVPLYFQRAVKPLCLALLMTKKEVGTELSRSG
jgi:hypothetical protein